MATAAADLVLECVFDGSIPMQDLEIQRRLYHRDCKCALHKLKGLRPNARSQHGIMSFPKKQAWKDCSLSIVTSKSSHSSPCNDLSNKNREDASQAISSKQ